MGKRKETEEKKNMACSQGGDTKRKKKRPAQGQKREVSPGWEGGSWDREAKEDNQKTKEVPRWIKGERYALEQGPK